MCYVKTRMKYTILLILILAMSCKETKKTPVKPATNYKSFRYAIYNDAPIYEDEYLYPKQSKKALLIALDSIAFYQIDWDDDGLFGEIGVDYIGLKSKLEHKPIIEKLSTSNNIRINGNAYKVSSVDDELELEQIELDGSVQLNLITEFAPIELEDGQIYDVESQADSVVIYFWATWCAPCIETLKRLPLQELKDDGIDFIPIAYNCSNSKEFLDANDLPFDDLRISEKSAQVYNIKSLAKQYTFLRDGAVSGVNVYLRGYYDGDR